MISKISTTMFHTNELGLQRADFLGRLLANLKITSHGDNRREIKHYGKMLHTLCYEK